MAGHTVEFFFDYASPYAYFGSELVEAVCLRGKAELKWLPMVLGGIFQARETKALLFRPAQRDYMLGDLAALSEVHRVPYQARTEFLFKPILALRCTLQVPQGAERAKGVHALYRAAWREDKNLGDPAVAAAALSGAGFDGPALVAGAENAAVKDELKQLTNQALARGVFGAPTMFLDGKRMFWGHDRLPLLEHYLTRG
jgi:2-hydroxychromene-2-carboxylate isomerase